MDILGIDIGTVSVKYVRCRGTAGRSLVTSQGDYPYNGSLEDLESILADIRVKEGTGLEIAVAISSPDIIKKTFTVPILPKKEQKDAFNWAATKLVPAALDTMAYEHLMLGRVEEKGAMKDEVLFVGAPKSFINRILSTFTRADLKPVTLITDIAFGYVYSLGEIGERSVAVVDLGGKQTGLYIARGNKLMFAREILTASESFSDALMSGSGLTFDKAEEYKKERGFDGELTEILKIPFERLTGEIQRTFSVYNQRYPDKPITSVYITGRGIRIPHFFEKLEDTLIEEVNFLESIHETEDKYIPARALCMNAEVLPNLLPESAQKKEQQRAYRRYIAIGSFFLAAVLLLITFNLMGRAKRAGILVNAERRTLGMMKTSLGALGKGIPEASPDTREIASIQQEIPRKDITFVTLLKYLSSELPREAVLKSIEFGENTNQNPPPQPSQTNVHPTPGGQARTIPGPFRDPAQPAVPESFSGYYPLVLKGYIFGKPDNPELGLFDIVLSLRASGFIDRVEVLQKDKKELKGKPVIEFTILARCARHEI